MLGASGDLPGGRCRPTMLGIEISVKRCGSGMSGVIGRANAIEVFSWTSQCLVVQARRSGDGGTHFSALLSDDDRRSGAGRDSMCAARHNTGGLGPAITSAAALRRRAGSTVPDDRRLLPVRPAGPGRLRGAPRRRLPANARNAVAGPGALRAADRPSHAVRQRCLHRPRGWLDASAQLGGPGRCRANRECTPNLQVGGTHHGRPDRCRLSHVDQVYPTPHRPHRRATSKSATSASTPPRYPPGDPALRSIRHAERQAYVCAMSALIQGAPGNRLIPMGRYFQFAQRRSGHRSCLLLKSGKCPHWEVLPTFVARLVE